ncbi:MAG TPA: carboxypeptidase regulatory-like domain-containing protein, partial [Gemmatimonadaceae bacterium]|nr:carboxypeptidase regulatory-like domain-containing protein [Gemmatimonadaceae bacterium]
MSSVFIAACASDNSVAAPVVPGEAPAAQFRPLAFTADVNTTTGKISITAPTATTANAPTLSTSGEEAPNLSLLGGEAVRLIPSNYQASAVGAFAPGKIRVTFDVLIENKLPGVRFITPTWPVSPAAGVILFPLDYVVTTTPGGVTGTDGNVVIVEQPRFGAVEPSIDWSGSGAPGSGAPYSFFNDADCSLASSNDCFRWEAFDAEIQPLTTSSVRTIGFDIDATVGQFRARMIVAADLAPAGAVTPGSVSGVVSSPTRGNLSGVTVTASTGQTATTDAAGAYSLAGVNAGSRTVTISNLPAGCTATPPANTQTVSVASGANSVANFVAVVCTGLPGVISGTITSDNAGQTLPGVTVTASTGGSATTDATGAYSIATAGPGAGTIALSGLPTGCIAPSAPYTLASGGAATVNVVVDCPAPPTPGYQYNTTWTVLSPTQVAVDIRLDMRTFNNPSVVDVTTSGVTGDPLTGA